MIINPAKLTYSIRLIYTKFKENNPFFYLPNKSIKRKIIAIIFQIKFQSKLIASKFLSPTNPADLARAKDIALQNFKASEEINEATQKQEQFHIQKHRDNGFTSIFLLATVSS